MTEKKKWFGAWKKEGPKGTYYMGSFECEGKEFVLFMNKNSYKTEGDNKPELNFSIEPARAKAPKPTGSNPPPEDDISF